MSNRLEEAVAELKKALKNAREIAKEDGGSFHLDEWLGYAAPPSFTRGQAKAFLKEHGFEYFEELSDDFGAEYDLALSAYKEANPYSDWREGYDAADKATADHPWNKANTLFGFCEELCENPALIDDWLSGKDWEDLEDCNYQNIFGDQWVTSSMHC